MVHIGKLTDGNGTWGLIDKIEGRCGGPTVYFYGFGTRSIMVVWPPKRLVKPINIMKRMIWGAWYTVASRYRSSKLSSYVAKGWLYLTLRGAPWYVNIYEVDRAYGGSEEGGWWYDTGTPCNSPYGKASFKCWTRKQAEALRDRMRQEIEQPDTYVDSKGWGFGKLVPHIDRNSMIGGPDIEVYIERWPAAAFPTHRPHYE